MRILSVETDEHLYTGEDLKENLRLTAGRHVAIEYRAIDFKTHPQKRQYRYRIVRANGEFERDWQMIRGSTLDYIFRKPGAYTFEVVAIDRNLNYSQSSRMALKVIPPWLLLH